MGMPWLLVEPAVLAQDGGVKKLLDYYQARRWRLRLWPVHTGGMDKLLTYPMPCKGITAQVPTHQKG